MYLSTAVGILTNHLFGPTSQLKTFGSSRPPAPARGRDAGSAGKLGQAGLGASGLPLSFRVQYCPQPFTCHLKEGPKLVLVWGPEHLFNGAKTRRPHLSGPALRWSEGTSHVLEGLKTLVAPRSALAEHVGGPGVHEKCDSGNFMAANLLTFVS